MGPLGTNTTTVSYKTRVRLQVSNADADLKTEVISPLFKLIAQFDVTQPENGYIVYAENTTTKVKWSILKGVGID